MKSVKTHLYFVGIFIFISLVLATRVYAADADTHKSFERKPTYEQAVGNLINEYAISLDSENGFKSDLWGTLQFEDQGTQLYIIFIRLFELDKYKNVMQCNACSAVLASVTYIRNKDKWAIKGMNAEITRIGSDGFFTDFDQSIYKILDGKHLILSSDTKLRQGYFL